MNKEKIKELEEQIKVLKEEKPRTNIEVLESIESSLKDILYNLPKKTSLDYLRESLPPGTSLLEDLPIEEQNIILRFNNKPERK